MVKPVKVSERRYPLARCTHVTNRAAAARIDAEGFRPAHAGYGHAIYLTCGQFSDAIEYYSTYWVNTVDDAVIYACTVDPGRCLSVELPVEWVEEYELEEIAEGVRDALAVYFDVSPVGSAADIAAAHGFDSLHIDCVVFDSSFGGTQLAVFDPARVNVIARHTTEQVDDLLAWCYA